MTNIVAQESAAAIPPWPELRRYAGRALDRVALPIGGIGTGTISLGGRGDLRDFEVMNRPAKGFRPKEAFFALRVAGAGEPVLRVLEGPIPSDLVEGADGSPVTHAGLPRFRRAEFGTAYPFGRVELRDPELPVDVDLEAFNPFVPPDAEASGLPVAVLRWRIRNTGDQAVEADVAGVLSNIAGTPYPSQLGGPAGPGNRNAHRVGAGVDGVLLSGGEAGGERTGSMALAALGASRTSARTDWAALSWSGDLLDFLDDFVADGCLDERTGDRPDPVASVTAGGAIAPGETLALAFLLAWHFPNRVAWRTSGSVPDEPGADEIVGNFYTTPYADAWAVVEDVVPRLGELEAASREFTLAVTESTLPEPMREAALFTTSTLRTQTTFRTADGRFFGWEGMNDHAGWCHGTCTHVWNYEQATPFLFGALSRSLREVEYAHATTDFGHMSFRVGLPLERRAREWDLAAADGQMGCLVKLYRDWQLSGDDGMLAALWPAARRTMEFVWIEGGWDADRDGVMEGAQHNTMDVEYYGPNPNIACWYLAALEATARMADHAGDADFAGT
ncbi:MAG: GH116 family glycosyl-hydrolase [Mycobacteriales bacterium]